MKPLVAVLIALAVGVTGCDRSEEPAGGGGALSGTCGLPKVSKKVDPSKVSDEFVLEGVEIARTQDTKGRFIATINAPYVVNEAYRLYQDQVLDAGWKIVTHETEGFEAEIYLSDPDHLAAIQIRSSTCKNKVIVFVSIVDRGDLPTG